MKKLHVLAALLILVSIPAFAHSGHVHTYMGTVTMLHGDNSFMMETAKGDVMTIQTSGKTTFMHADNHKARLSELAEGMRVVVKMSADGKMAASVKMSKAKK